MSTETLQIDSALRDYLLEHSVHEPEALCRLREETARLEQARMQISPEQGQLMALLVELIGARKCLEIGTFTGYSAARVALALPPDGRVVACDSSEEWTSIARRYWQEAGVADKIDLRLAPAADTLESLLRKGEAGTFDFAFIDADKQSYDLYYEHCLLLVRQGGMIAVDNVLWGGRVADSKERDAETEAIRRLNRKIHSDSRVSASLVPIGDGLMLARKR